MSNHGAVGEGVFDVVIVGSGAAGLTAAVVAAHCGLSVVVLEKSRWVGGTTALSGGVLWVPNNDHVADVGQTDSIEKARTYLDAVVGDLVSADWKDTYLARAPEAMRFLEQHSDLKCSTRAITPDYLSELPGASSGGRILDPLEFDGRILGERFKDLRPPLAEFGLFGKLMVNRIDVDRLLSATRSPASAWHALKLVTRYAWDRLRYPRGTRLLMGNALAARLYKSVLDLGLPVRMNHAVKQLLRENDRVVGVEVDSPAGVLVLRARHAVILATGGFAASGAMRRELLPEAPEPLSSANPDSVGDGIRMALEQGGVVAPPNTNNAFWTPVSLGQRPDGSTVRFPHLMFDRAKPGLIAVNGAGQRFTNEADSYHEFGRALTGTATGTPVPVAYVLCDHRFITRYTFGMVRPTRSSLQSCLKSGYLVRAESMEALAQKIELPAQALVRTVADYNADAAAGLDRAFGKGSSAYNRYLGDATHAPNPCLAPLDRAPFYAIRVYAGDIGTTRGLVTNTDSQVLDQGSLAIAGLYACGNDMNSMMGGEYPGAGITLGPAVTFAYLAVQHIAHSAGQA